MNYLIPSQELTYKKTGTLFFRKQIHPLFQKLFKFKRSISSIKSSICLSFILFSHCLKTIFKNAKPTKFVQHPKCIMRSNIYWYISNLKCYDFDVKFTRISTPKCNFQVYSESSSNVFFYCIYVYLALLSIKQLMLQKCSFCWINVYFQWQTAHCVEQAKYGETMLFTEIRIIAAFPFAASHLHQTIPQQFKAAIIGMLRIYLYIQL